MSASPSGSRIVVLAPHAERVQRADPQPLAERIGTLRGTTIGFVDNGFAAIAIIHEELRRALEGQGIGVVIERKRYWRPLDVDRLDALAAASDAVIGGLCNTPPSTAFGVHDAVELERRGTPTVALVTQHYEDLIAESAGIEGMPDLRRIVLPYPLEGEPEAVVRAVAAQSIELVIAALTDPASLPVRRVAVAPVP